MLRIEKTVFISYRRTNVSWALAIYQNLTHHGYDVFFDFQSIASGDFERVLLESIKARAHFVVLLTPLALERCAEPGDWLRREIETALETQRNIVPLTLEGFDFATPALAQALTGKLVALKQYNTLSMPPQYFEEAMARLRDKYLNVPLAAVLHPLENSTKQAVQKQQAAANAAPIVKAKELTVQEWVEQGFNLISPAEQIHVYTEELHLNPNNAAVYGYRGIARYALREYQAAIDDYNQALYLNPKDVFAYYNRGLAQYALGEHQAAIHDYTHAIHLDPKDATTYSNRGNAHRALGKYQAAIDDYTKALHLNPTYANAYYARGLARSAFGDRQAAIEDYTKAAELYRQQGKKEQYQQTLNKIKRLSKPWWWGWMPILSSL